MLKIFELSYLNKIPLSCTFELTQKCNLNCIHCYINNKNRENSEISTRQVKKALTELAREGSLYLVLTGGEIFLRPDIIEICRFARSLNFDLRLFTNLTMITEKQIKDISKLNLTAVEVSLYGRKSIHDRTTSVKGSFDVTIANAKLLIKNKVPVVFKTPLMKHNINETAFLTNIAKRLGAAVKFDPTIAPSDDGSKEILKLRAGEKELRKIYGNELEKRKTRIANLGNEYNDLLCSAGHNLAAINSRGEVFPCLQLPLALGNIKRASFNKIWGKSKILKSLRKLKNSDIKTCRTCPDAPACQRCPCLALIEDGDMLGPSSISCKIAKMA